jgi:hypothetical protein
MYPDVAERRKNRNSSKTPGHDLSLIPGCLLAGGAGCSASTICNARPCGARRTMACCPCRRHATAITTANSGLAPSYCAGRPLRAAGPRTLGTPQLHRLSLRAESSLHNEYIDRYYHLGYQPLPGARRRDLVRAVGRLVAWLSFAAATWKTQPHDHPIGWTPSQRQQPLHRVVNNARQFFSPDRPSFCGQRPVGVGWRRSATAQERTPRKSARTSHRGGLGAG